MALAVFLWSANLSISAFATDSVITAPAADANRSGSRLEQTIEDGLRKIGFEIIPFRQWREARLYRDADMLAVVTNAPYRSVYGHRARIEFLVIVKRGTVNRQILVEVKRQRVKGSVDEKLAYVYLNALENIAEREFVLVIDGDGWKPQARSWIERKANDTRGFFVFKPAMFLAWITSVKAMP